MLVHIGRVYTPLYMEHKLTVINYPQNDPWHQM